MSILKLYATATGTTYVSDNVDIQADGRIYAIFGYVSMTVDSSPAAGDSFVGELSFLSTNTVNVHATRGSIVQLEALFSPVLASSTLKHGAEMVMLSNLDIPVVAGERLYVFARGAQSDITGTTVFHVFIDDTVRRRGARRR